MKNRFVKTEILLGAEGPFIIAGMVFIILAFWGNVRLTANFSLYNYSMAGAVLLYGLWFRPWRRREVQGFSQVIHFHGWPEKFEIASAVVLAVAGYFELWLFSAIFFSVYMLWKVVEIHIDRWLLCANLFK